MEQRRARRFKLQLPLSVTKSGPERVIQHGITRNISSGGVLFTSDTSADVGVLIEYTIGLEGDSQGAVNLRCLGKVVRSERVPTGNGATPAFAVAATLERYEFLRHSAGRRRH